MQWEDMEVTGRVPTHPRASSGMALYRVTPFYPPISCEGERGSPSYPDRSKRLSVSFTDDETDSEIQLKPTYQPKTMQLMPSRLLLRVSCMLNTDAVHLQYQQISLSPLRSPVSGINILILKMRQLKLREVQYLEITQQLLDPELEPRAVLY